MTRCWPGSRLLPQDKRPKEEIGTCPPPSPIERTAWVLVLPGLQVPEGRVVADPGVGRLRGRDKRVVFRELLRVANEAVGHLGDLHAVSVQLDVQEGDLQREDDEVGGGVGWGGEGEGERERKRVRERER